MPKQLPSVFLQAAIEHGISESELNRQWVRLQSGPSHCAPLAPCRRGDGIHTFSPTELVRWAEQGASLNDGAVVRFVPASGAASRMFKALASKNQDAVDQLNRRWEEFPFRADAEATGPCDGADQKWDAVMRRLGLPDMPKGALPFHLYPDGARTAFEEHMREWKATLSESKRPLIHYTLPDSGREDWEQLLSVASGRSGVDVSTSVQHPATDTMAVGEDGQPFVTSEGHPLFRPGGHGALLKNLADLGRMHPGALISIKNIDNVRPESAHAVVLPWRRALLGWAAELDARRRDALQALAQGNLTPAKLWLAEGFAHPGDPRPETREALTAALDRPLLVAGMVRNEGEPGGGPFWLRDSDGVLRAQIVESAEMDLADPQIGNCIAGATHFNPVDLVCVLHDEAGKPYDLNRFIDSRRDFLVSKSHGGRSLMGLEHPGLWNGAMGCWNTYFVEVPSETFAPVKTIFDLLRPSHKA